MDSSKMSFLVAIAMYFEIHTFYEQIFQIIDKFDYSKISFLVASAKLFQIVDKYEMQISSRISLIVQ